MTRPSPLALVLAAAVLLLAAAPATASPKTSAPQSTVSVEFEVAANHGLEAQVENFAKEVTFSLVDKHHLVSYRVHGEVTEAGLKARFGKLGLIDVGFTPTKTLSTSQPPKRCKGEPWTEREGIFSGTIQFTGEREYVRVEAVQAKGTMSVTSEWQCPRKEGPIHIDGPPRLSAPAFRGEPEATKESATLSASSRRCRCGFAAFGIRNRSGRGPSSFFGAIAEDREGMKISRGAFANARASAFTFDHEAGTATVRPPQPFSGSGTFKRRPHGRDLWRSTIRVPLLGADPVSFNGRDFRAILRRDFPGD